MNFESDIKEEIYKCSKCGLCKSVCPVYITTKNEMFLPRGRYIVINRALNNNKKLNKEFIKNLDICLNCDACKNFCPSNIDTYKIQTHIKNEYKLHIIPFSMRYKILLKAMRILRYIYKYLHIKSVFLNSIFDKLFEIRVLRNKTKQNSDIKGNVVFFEGCINKYINPTDKNAALNLIEKMNYNITKVISNCCGYPYISEGNLEKYNKNIKNIIKSIPQNTQYIICSCDTCYDTLKRCIACTENAKEFLSKLITIDNFLKINNFNFNEYKKAIYFKPLLRQEECYLPKEVENIKRKGLCSTMENFFALKYPNYTKDLINTVFYSNEEINDKTIVTSCLISQMGLITAIKKTGYNTDVITYSEYISRQI